MSGDGDTSVPDLHDGSAGDGLRPQRRAWRPSLRVTAAMAATMLAIGVAVGAAIGPAPDASLAVASRLPSLLPALIARAEANRAQAAAAASAAAAPAASAATPTGHMRRRRKHRRATLTAEQSPPASEQTPASSAPSNGGRSGAKPAPLPAVSKVWLIELSGATFAEALAAPTNAPFIDSDAIPAGALLDEWSSLQAGAFANEAALLAPGEAQLAETILQPPCPEGAAGAQCAAGTPGALKTADEFLAATLPTITASAAYRTNGLVVITFATSAAGSASGLPAGSTTETLSSKPPAGALLISPFVTAGKRPTRSFNPSSPRQTLQALLHN